MEPAIISSVSGIFGVILGAGLVLYKDFILQKANWDRKARYLTVRVVCILDQFAMDCLDVAYDDGLVDGNLVDEFVDGKLVGSRCIPQVKDPAIEYPDNVDWESINVNLTYKLLNIPSRLHRANRIISDTAEFDCCPYYEVTDERRYQYACLGLHVIDIAEEMRRQFKIEKGNHLDHSLADSLDKVKQEFEKNRKDRVPGQ
ncbi:MAG: hypothetical protein HQL51_13630 [Magnetococcales bacterium]|nr:hypothetical protein [Magnetococcales bacterium]